MPQGPVTYTNLASTPTPSGQMFTLSALFNVVATATTNATTKLKQIQALGSAISIGDMFEMQMLMNNLSQMSEMASAIVSASNSTIMGMLRAIKS